MQLPTRADYVGVYFTLFELFQQERAKDVRLGHPFEYKDRISIVFFTMMSIRGITAFKAQHRWLQHHFTEAFALGFEKTPHRTTLSRRFKALIQFYKLLSFLLGIGQKICTQILTAKC